MKTKFMILLAALGLAGASARAAIVLGDIAIIGIGADSKDLSFVTLNDITAGSSVTFTDSGWLTDTGAFRGGEGAATYTFASNTAAGTVISGSGTSNATWGANTNWTGADDATLGTNGMNFSTSGDGVLAFTGTSASPTFVYAASTVPFGFSTSSSSSSNNTGVPSGLTEGTNAVSVASGTGAGNEFDNIWYSGTTSFASPAAALAAISDSANWTGNNSSYSPVTTSFSIIPEPSSIIMMGLVGLAAAMILRKRK